MTFEEQQTKVSNSVSTTPAPSVVDVGMAPPMFEEIEDCDDDADGEPTADMSPEEIAKLLDKQKGKRLKHTAGKIHKARRVITEKLLLIADLLSGAGHDLRRGAPNGEKEIAASPAKIRAFALNEAGIPRDEISTYLQLAKTSLPEREVLKENGANFAVLKAIAGDAGLRRDIIDRMQAQITMDIAAVRRVRRQRKYATETQLETLLREQPQLARLASRTETRAAIRTFETDMAGFVRELVAFHGAVELADEDYNGRAGEIATSAKSLLSRLGAIIDTDDMPDSWYDLWNGGWGPRGFEASHIALTDIAYGEFFVRDGDRYLDSDDINIDWHLVAAVGRLAGLRPEALIQANTSPRKTKRSHRVAATPALPKLVEPPKPLRSIEVCAGAGGQALGLHAAGFHARAIFELMEDAAETLRANFDTAVPRVFAEDITKVDFRHFGDGIDLVAGGVPCQPWSTAGQRQGEADERDLFRRAVEIVDEVQPRAFFFENVQGFGHSTNLSYRTELHAAFEAIGYKSRVYPIVGSDYGLAQGRPRIAFIGFRDADAMARFEMPPCFPQWRLSLADAIGDLVSARGWRGYDAWRNIAYGTAPTIVGGSRKSDKHSFSSGLTKQTWADLGIDSSSLTKSAPSADHQGLFKLTLEMGARLQGFPDDWRFVGRPQQIKSQIGNAFPPVMARAVGLAIYAALEGIAFDYETALKTPLRAPKPPAPSMSRDPNARSAIRTPTLLARHQRFVRIQEEHEFFGEVHRDLDEHDGEIQTVDEPGAYRLKD